jgi:hypothetical protein
MTGDTENKLSHYHITPAAQALRISGAVRPSSHQHIISLAHYRIIAFSQLLHPHIKPLIK